MQNVDLNKYRRWTAACVICVSESICLKLVARRTHGTCQNEIPTSFQHPHTTPSQSTRATQHPAATTTTKTHTHQSRNNPPNTHTNSRKTYNYKHNFTHTNPLNTCTHTKMTQHDPIGNTFFMAVTFTHNSTHRPKQQKAIQWNSYKTLLLCSVKSDENIYSTCIWFPSRETSLRNKWFWQLNSVKRNFSQEQVILTVVFNFRQEKLLSGTRDSDSCI